MQADNAVREETWLTDLDALDRYTARFTLVGGGGTDFRPAFARIAELRREGRCATCRACFTLPTARASTRPSARRLRLLFCFGGRHPAARCAPWAMRLVLQPEEFTPDTDPKGR